MRTCSSHLLLLVRPLTSLQNNFMRCSLGAVTVSVVDLMINAMGVGWTYVLLSGLCILTGPLMFVIMYIGPKFRAKRRARQAAKQVQ